jgi:large subunit ribosomal protein L4
MKKQKNKKKEMNLECPVKNAKGKKIDTVSLNSKVFDGSLRPALIQQIVMMYQAGQRAGTASTKTKAEVSGGGRKPWRQKGTGRARTGSIRNPLWRGGGIIFGPKPRDFSFAMPAKMKKRAVKSSLNDKLLNDRIIVVDAIEVPEIKTKAFSAVLNSLGISKGESAIVILDKLDKNTKLASRNIPNVSVKDIKNFNAYDILHKKKLVIQLSSLKTLMKALQ